MLQLVFCMGNPWVFLAVPIPIPIPTKTHTHTMGMGFFMGQHFCTHTQPIPMAGNPWVYNYLHNLQHAVLKACASYINFTTFIPKQEKPVTYDYVYGFSMDINSHTHTHGNTHRKPMGYPYLCRTLGLSSSQIRPSKQETLAQRLQHSRVLYSIFSESCKFATD
jgi:hypothetical protein